MIKHDGMKFKDHVRKVWRCHTILLISTTVEAWPGCREISREDVLTHVIGRRCRASHQILSPFVRMQQLC